MGRPLKKPLATVADWEGNDWAAYLVAPSPHGVVCYRGWPAFWLESRRGLGCLGGMSWVLTAELLAWLESIRFAALEHLPGMPFGASALKRMRRQLGHHGKTDRRDWWLERLDDLETLTSMAFVAKHPRLTESLSDAAVDMARMDLLGWRGQRAAAPWRAHADLLLSGQPTQVIADALNLSIDTVCKMRWRLEDERGIPHHREKGRYDA